MKLVLSSSYVTIGGGGRKPAASLNSLRILCVDVHNQVGLRDGETRGRSRAALDSEDPRIRV